MAALPAVRSGRDSLALLEEGRRLLALANTAGEVKRLRDQAAAVQRYMAQQRFALGAIQDAAELKLRAERRLGEILAGTVVPRGNHGPGVNGARPSLPEGVGKAQSHRWQRVASILEDVFKVEVAAGRRRGHELTTARFLRLAVRTVRQRARDAARRRMARGGDADGAGPRRRLPRGPG